MYKTLQILALECCLSIVHKRTEHPWSGLVTRFGGREWKRIAPGHGWSRGQEVYDVASQLCPKERGRYERHGAV